MRKKHASTLEFLSFSHSRIKYRSIFDRIFTSIDHNFYYFFLLLFLLFANPFVKRTNCVKELNEHVCKE